MLHVLARPGLSSKNATGSLQPKKEAVAVSGRLDPNKSQRFSIEFDVLSI